MKTSFGIRQDDLGFFSAEPLPSAEELKAFYRDVYYQQLSSSTYQSAYSSDEIAHRDLKSRQVLYALNEVRSPATSGQLVEIGCGEGFFLAAAREAGFAVSGVDFSAHGISHFHPDLASCVFVGDAHDYLTQMRSEGRRFDVCVMQNVVEHVIDPRALLRDVRASLAEHGMIAVKVPNDFSPLQQSAQAKGLIDRPFWFAPPQHLHYFTPPTLAALLQAEGFEVLDTFGDFPIEWFLCHPASNYVRDPAQGKAAHRARVSLELMMGEQGMPAYHRLCQALTGCGMGRNIVMIARSRPAGT